MDRIQLVQRLLRECILSSASITGFLEKPRKYAAGDHLYMREVHFVVAVGPNHTYTMSEMAHLLKVTQGAVTQMATKLEKKGYIIRAKDSQDKRLTTVSLTEKGRQLCNDHIAYDQDRYLHASDVLKQYSDQDLENLIQFTQIIRELFANET